MLNGPFFALDQLVAKQLDLLAHLLGFCRLLLILNDHLGNEDKFSRVSLFFDPAAELLLHQAHHENLLLEACCFLNHAVLREYLADNRDEEVEQDNDHEQAVNKEYKPVNLTVELQAIIKFAQGHEEGTLPYDDVVLKILDVEDGVWVSCRQLNVPV